jgi:superfamily II DNA helicase RecQ
MDSFVQQYGRAGRDGGNAMSMLIYTKRDVKQLDSDMKLYIENENNCRRELILSCYKSKPLIDRNLHLCCDVCAKKCQVKDCENCEQSIHPYYKTDIPLAYSDSSSNDDGDTGLFSDSDFD